MSSLARTMLVLTLPAAAAGALAGLVLRSVEVPPQPPPVAVSAESAGDDAPRTAPVVTRTPRRRTGRAGSSRRVVGQGHEGVQLLDPEYARRLSSDDEDERLRCAVELLRMGPDRAGAIDALPVVGAEGLRLRDALTNSLSSLGEIERGTSWPLMREAARLDVRLKYYRKVVDDGWLREERRRYWELRTQSYPATPAGESPAGAAARAALEFALVRKELGEISEEEWARVRAATLPAVRAWAADLRRRPDASGESIRDAEASLVRLER